MQSEYKMSRKYNEIVLVLENIRSVHNVGAIFRTAETASVSKIFLTGYTPGPLDRFGRGRVDFKKAALGAESFVPWESATTAEEVIKKLKTEGFFIVAIEQDKKSTDYKKVLPKKKTALVFGNEVEGLSREAINLCDQIAEIPMKGRLARNRQPDDVGKESLNVSVAAGIALFGIFDR